MQCTASASANMSFTLCAASCCHWFNGHDQVKHTFCMKMAAPTHRILLSSHAVPQRLNPLSTQYPKHHHERVEEVTEIPSIKQNGCFISVLTWSHIKITAVCFFKCVI